ncbi:hypothetical protein NDU88_001577 [Pleurodeles waltl]|uniref:Uncharacterized protein n=1 Tax=Pleurodeles waltl TaxID=8319 RepID=A0AAV7UT48_PLEWA|nr:hypothetical protein NDU88_001577 [Pleurodeles waltl]
MEPELQVLPMLVYLLIRQEHQRRCRADHGCKLMVVLVLVVVLQVVVVGSKLPPASPDGCLLGVLLMTGVVAPARHVVVQMAVQVAVLVAVSAAEMLPVLAVVQVLVVVEGDTRRSPEASDGCPLGMMLLTVVVAAAVQVAVQGWCRCGAGGGADDGACGGACGGAFHGTGCRAVGTDGGHQSLTWRLVA